MATNTPQHPISISRLNDTYYVYNPATAAHLRSHHRIPGVLTGTLPQSPQQNIFLGLPLQLMPEEVLLLVQKGAAYVVDDAALHAEGFAALGREGRLRWRKCLEDRGKEMARGLRAEKEREGRRRRRALGARGGERRERRGVSQGFSGGPASEERNEDETDGAELRDTSPGGEHDEGLDSAFAEAASLTGGGTSDADPADLPRESKAHPCNINPNKPPQPPPSPIPQHSNPNSEPDSDPVPVPYHITPTTSQPPLPQPQPPNNHPSSSSTTKTPSLPPLSPPPPSSSYPLYHHLHTQSYYLSPGLRFGCNYLVYPGDPLRFHSHFLAVSRAWDEEVDLLSLIGGGRLGTGVKKGFLLGGVETNGKPGDGQGALDPEGEGEGRVRCFCVEWGGM